MNPITKHLSGTDRGGKIPRKKWVKSKAELISASNRAEYLAGFHIFLSHHDAVAYTIPEGPYVLAKVKFKNVLAFGEQLTNYPTKAVPCVIADEIKFVEIIHDISIS
jgi:hypothetical protein